MMHTLKRYNPSFREVGREVTLHKCKVLGGAALALLLTLGGCGGKAGLPLQDREQGFSLRIDPASAYGGGELGALRLVAAPANDSLELRIETTGARNLKALYVEVQITDPPI